MKNQILLFFAIIQSAFSFAQCTLEPFSLEKRISISDMVIEGRIISEEGFRIGGGSFIYTAQVVKVSKLFKGVESQIVDGTITVITEGGIIGLDALKVEPALSLQMNEVGVFFLKSDQKFENGCSVCGEFNFVGVASEQSFVKYDESELIAFGYFEKYVAIEAELYPKIEAITKQSFKEISKIQIGSDGIRSLSAPVISSFDMDTLASGTGTILTITGSNFGIARGKGKVEFVDANFGDGRYFNPNYPSSYKSWSNTKIEVFVPARAGTGKIKITNNSNESAVATDDIYVKYAHSDIGYGGTTGIDSGFYQLNLVNDNGKGGYTWVFNNKFAAKSNAVNAFLRAAENWRCQTLMNWDVGSNTTVDDILRDNNNVVRFTKFGDSRLGVCYSWYSGCFNGGKVYWYASELDIDFDSTRNWYYGTAKPGGSQIDFEGVATHELGHGHQLAHVIDNSKIMHYSVGPGSRNVTLSDNDIEGGEYVRNKSVTGDPCGPGKFKSINAADCNLTKPIAKLLVSDTVVCPGRNITVTDDSKGKVNVYTWNFGVDASPANANTVGSHKVAYRSSGKKTLTLIVSNDFGVDTFYKSILVSPDIPKAPSSFIHDTVACVGTSKYFINKVTDATAYQWTLSAGGSFVGTRLDTAATVKWTTPGNGYKLSIVAINSCGASAETVADIDVINRVVPNFSAAENGLTISFSNSSTNSTRYLWVWGDNDSLEENHPSRPTHKYSTKGIYKVKLTAFNECSDSTIEKEIVVEYGVGIASNELLNLKIYPNPSNNFVMVEGAGVGYKAQVFDQMGRLIKSQNIQSSNELISLTEVQNGLYMFEVTNLDGQYFYTQLLISK